MVYVGILIVLIIIFWNIDKVTDLKHKFRIKDTIVYKSLNLKRFSVDINYRVSATLNYNFKKVMAISFTIINKTGDVLKKITVSVKGYKAVDVPSTNIAGEEGGYMDHHTLSQFKHIGNNLAPGEMRSGYLLLEANEENTESGTLVVTCDDETNEVIVRSDQIFDEAVVQHL